MTMTQPPPLPPKTETFKLLLAFLVLVSIYNIFNIARLFAFVEHEAFSFIGQENVHKLATAPIVIAMIVQSVALCRFKNMARRIQAGISCLAPIIRVWGIYDLHQNHPERIWPGLWTFLVVAITFDIIVVFVTNSQKMRRATRK